MPDLDHEALAELYGAQPEEFTALRKTLADAAKARGDAAAAKRISASPKPTTAAWVLNTIARSDDAKDRLADLGERLRTAHAAMDGDGIRALSAAQRKLIDELVRAGFTEVALTNPSSALREDITGTLQAAIADPDVLARLGQLAKAERWSGFGEFGSSTAVSAHVTAKKSATPTNEAPAKKTPAKKTPKPQPDDTREREREKQREREKELARAEREKARAVVAQAERAKAAADDEMSQRQVQLTAARRKHDEARAALRAAERELAAAEESADDAERANHEAAQRVIDAKKHLRAKG
ncbi:MAG: hypothetical protein ABWY93_07425 [Mycobacterium sp.]